MSATVQQQLNALPTIHLVVAIDATGNHERRSVHATAGFDVCTAVEEQAEHFSPVFWQAADPHSLPC